MATIFKTGWDAAKSKYPENQAYLDCFRESCILKALYDAQAHYSNPWVRAMLAAASDPMNKETLTVMQGTHQTEDMNRGGFCLHFTASFKGHTFHFYVIQENNSDLRIFEISYDKNTSYFWA